MGLISFTLTGCGFVVIGALEVLTRDRNASPSSSLNQIKTAIVGRSPEMKRKANLSSSRLTFLTIFVFSLLFIVNSLVSLSDAVSSSDSIGTALQLQSFAVSSLFLMYAVLGLMKNLKNSLPLPSSLLNLVFLFAFVEEFLLFYLQRKDPNGIENQYYGLLLLPITVCVFSTFMAFISPASNLPILSRGVGLLLQGTWFLQMGFSFYSDFIAHGCSMTEKSRGNFTIKCNGHQDYHRGRAIATLQFNCHLAFLVVLAVCFYAIVVDKNGVRNDPKLYRPIGAELQSLDGRPEFTLDSDEIDEEENGEKHSGAALEGSMNGFDLQL